MTSRLRTAADWLLKLKALQRDHPSVYEARKTKGEVDRAWAELEAAVKEDRSHE